MSEGGKRIWVCLFVRSADTIKIDSHEQPIDKEGYKQDHDDRGDY